MTAERQVSSDPSILLPCCTGVCAGPVGAAVGGRRSACIPHWPHGRRRSGDHVYHRSRRIHRHGAGQGPRGRWPSGIRSHALDRGGRSACVAPERYPSWATCSNLVSGRTRRRLTGSSISRPSCRVNARVTRRRAESIGRARGRDGCAPARRGGRRRDRPDRVRRRTRAATARRARVRSPKTNRRGPPPGAAALTPALDRLDGYIVAGLPIVTAFPGWVYGNGSWFRERVIEPVMAGRRVLQFGDTGPWVSPIHVHDCARALVHLAERGELAAGTSS